MHRFTPFVAYQGVPIAVIKDGDTLVVKNQAGEELSQDIFQQVSDILDKYENEANRKRQKLISSNIEQARSILGDLAVYLNIEAQTPLIQQVSISLNGAFITATVVDPDLTEALAKALSKG